MRGEFDMDQYPPLSDTEIVHTMGELMVAVGDGRIFKNVASMANELRRRRYADTRGRHVFGTPCAGMVTERCVYLRDNTKVVLSGPEHALSVVNQAVIRIQKIPPGDL